MNAILKICLFCFFGVASLGAQTITGTVLNQTTGKPAAGDDVVLMRLGEGMQEEARSRTGSDGGFALTVSVPGQPHFVRVVHQGVNHDQNLDGAEPLQITIYDAVARVPGLNGKIGIVQLESDDKALKVKEMYAITNASNPPLTQSRADNYEITLPAKAVFESVEVRSGNGIWVKVAPTPLAGRARTYGINFPIRPGDTLFKFAYRMPYQGPKTLHLRLPYPIARFGVMYPPAMQFKALQADSFKAQGIVTGLQLQTAAASPLVGDVPGFQVSGVGKAPEHGTHAALPPAVSPPPSAGPPNSPVNHGANSAVTAVNVMNQPRELWMVVGGILLIVSIGGVALWRTRKGFEPVAAGKSIGKSSLIEVLKEELFQLESDRLHGSISAEEYAASKNALNQNIQRALARQKQ